MDLKPPNSVAIMQPYFIPYLGYFSLMASVERFVVYGQVQHRRKSWFTRNRLKIDNQVRLMSPPVLAAPSNSLIANIRISLEPEWRRVMLAQIRHSYGRTPFFEETWPLVESILSNPNDSLYAFNLFGLKSIAAHLGITTEILSDANVHPGIEAHAYDQPDSERRRNARVVSICVGLNAKSYVNPESGRHLYDARYFLGSGVGLWFSSPEIDAVKSALGDASADLSILHVLMHHGQAKTYNCLNLARLTQAQATTAARQQISEGAKD